MNKKAYIYLVYIMTPLNIFALIVLFTLLSPNVLFRLPGNKYVSALLHGLLFALALYMYPILEGLCTEGLDAKGMRCESLRKKLAVKDIKENEKKKIENQLKQDKC